MVRDPDVHASYDGLSIERGVGRAMNLWLPLTRDEMLNRGVLFEAGD